MSQENRLTREELEHQTALVRAQIEELEQSVIRASLHAEAGEDQNRGGPWANINARWRGSGLSSSHPSRASG